MKNAAKFLSFKTAIILACLICTIGILKLHGSSVTSNWIPVFLVFVVLERLLETFFTSQEKQRDSILGDWALFGVVTTYLVVEFGAFYEHYLLRSTFQSWRIISVGFVVYWVSMYLRWWAIFSAGDQLGIHSVEQTRLATSRRIIRNGPYQYMRHPYYFCVCAEIVSIPIILGAWWSLLAATLLVCPLEILRGYLEERSLLQIFGWPYIKYQHERGGFFPLKKSANFDRRLQSMPIEFHERRTSNRD